MKRAHPSQNRLPTFLTRKGYSLPIVVVASLLCFSLGAKSMSQNPKANVIADDQCVNNLKRMYSLVKLYLHHSGGISFPKRIDSIYQMADSPSIFICRADSNARKSLRENPQYSSYEIVTNPLQPKLVGLLPSEIAIIIEKQANPDGRRSVLFFDGSVERLDEEHYRNLKDSGYVDKGR